MIEGLRVQLAAKTLAQAFPSDLVSSTERIGKYVARQVHKRLRYLCALNVMPGKPVLTSRLPADLTPRLLEQAWQGTAASVFGACRE